MFAPIKLEKILINIKAKNQKRINKTFNFYIINIKKGLNKILKEYYIQKYFFKRGNKNKMLLKYQF